MEESLPFYSYDLEIPKFINEARTAFGKCPYVMGTSGDHYLLYGSCGITQVTLLFDSGDRTKTKVFIQTNKEKKERLEDSLPKELTNLLFSFLGAHLEGLTAE